MSFRILHTSDWHLGVETGTANYSRTAEHAAFLDWLTKTIVAEKVDAVLIAGDVYHTSNASVEAQKMFFRFLAAAVVAAPGVIFVVTGGNHDNPDRLSLPGFLLDQVHFVGGLPYRDNAPDIDAIVIPLERTEQPRAVCLAFPFLRAHDLPQQDSEAAMAALWRRAADRAVTHYPSARLVGMAHLFTAGGNLSNTERPAFVGGADCVSIKSFPEELVYLALGHLHRPQQIQAKFLARYSGDVLPMSSAERNYRHSVVIADIPATGEAVARTVEIPDRVPFMCIPAKGEPMDLPQTLAAIKALEIADAEPGFEPFLEITVRPKEPTPTLGSQIADALAGKNVRLLGIFPDRSTETDTLHDAVAQGITVAEMNPAQIFEKIYISKHINKPGPALVQAFDKIVAEILAGDAR